MKNDPSLFSQTYLDGTCWDFHLEDENYLTLGKDYSIVKDSNADLIVGNWNSKKDA